MTSPAPAPFVPGTLDATRAGNVEPFVRALLGRHVATPGELERWILDRGELDAACSQAQADLYITQTCRTDDEQAQQAYAAFVEEASPKYRAWGFALDTRLVELAKKAPPPDRYEEMLRGVRADVAIFRQENIELQTRLDLLAQEYGRLCGAMTVEFDGKARTLPQMGVYQESPDRKEREAAWRAVSRRRLADAQAIEDIFDKMITLRHQIAQNAGHESFVSYSFVAKHRFDYTPAHCRAFHEACRKVVVPAMRRHEERRKRELKVDVLRPWDLAVDVKGRPALKPFAGGRELMAKSVAVFNALDGRLGAMLASMGDGSEARGSDGGACLDLDSRPGKAPGGYQYMRDRDRRPFIFMNAAGLMRDVSTMLHEAGHAFHSMLCVDEPLLAYRSSPIEFAEVASMSMELLTMPHWDAPGAFFANASEVGRARRNQLERSLFLLPWIATIDAFQLWLYENPAHTRAQRRDQWRALDAAFGSSVSWDGLEQERDAMWHKQPHLFDHPLYYIEYGIAQLGALRLWLRSLEEGPAAAVASYIKGLSLGGSRPLPELFAAAGIPFDFGPGAVEGVMERGEAELAKLPA